MNGRLGGTQRGRGRLAARGATKPRGCSGLGELGAQTPGGARLPPLPLPLLKRTRFEFGMAALMPWLAAECGDRVQPIAGDLSQWHWNIRLDDNTMLGCMNALREAKTTICHMARFEGDPATADDDCCLPQAIAGAPLPQMKGKVKHSEHKSN